MRIPLIFLEIARSGPNQVLFFRCANIGWELLYSVFYPLSTTEKLAYAPWLVIDGFLVWNTLKFGPGEWGSSPLVAQNIGNILAVSFTAIAGLEWALILTLDDSYQAGFWTGFGCQALLGCSSVVQLLSRNDTRGHSTTIWYGFPPRSIVG